MVAQLAEQLISGLIATNPDRLADRALVIAGALLYDIAKTLPEQRRCDHARMGGEICREHGYAEIAAIVEEHVRLRDFAPTRYQEGRFTARSWSTTRTSGCGTTWSCTWTSGSNTSSTTVARQPGAAPAHPGEFSKLPQPGGTPVPLAAVRPARLGAF